MVPEIPLPLYRVRHSLLQQCFVPVLQGAMMLPQGTSMIDLQTPSYSIKMERMLLSLLSFYPLSSFFSLFTQSLPSSLFCFPHLGQYNTSTQNLSAFESIYQASCQRCSNEKQGCRASDGSQAVLCANSWFHCLVALWPWASSLTSWCPYFLISKIRIIATSRCSVLVKI